MAVDFGGVKMQNPINTAAGTFGYGWQFQNFFDVSQLGAITMVCFGVMRGEADAVLAKAIRLCLECIGIG